MQHRTWQALVAIVAVGVVWLIWRGFADDLHLEGNRRTVFLACTTAIAVVGVVRVLQWLNPNSLFGKGHRPPADDPVRNPQNDTRKPD